MSDDYRIFIYDEDEVIARAQRIAEIRHRRESPWMYADHAPYLKDMLQEAYKSDDASPSWEPKG